MRELDERHADEMKDFRESKAREKDALEQSFVDQLRKLRLCYAEVRPYSHIRPYPSTVPTEQRLRSGVRSQGCIDGE